MMNYQQILDAVDGVAVTLNDIDQALGEVADTAQTSQWHTDAVDGLVVIFRGLAEMQRALGRAAQEQAEQEAAGCEVVYTTASEDYDGFGTRTVAANVGTTSNGKVVRRVLVKREYLEWQRSRYGSGLHLAANEAQWAEMLSMNLAVPAALVNPE